MAPRAARRLRPVAGDKAHRRRRDRAAQLPEAHPGPAAGVVAHRRRHLRRRGVGLGLGLLAGGAAVRQVERVVTLLWDAREGERARAHRRAHAITVHSSVRDGPAVWVKKAQQHAGSTAGRLAAEDDRGSGVAVPTLPAVVCRYCRRRRRHSTASGVANTALDATLGLQRSLASSGGYFQRTTARTSWGRGVMRVANKLLSPKKRHADLAFQPRLVP